MPRAINLFYSYSHRDQDLRDELEKHLSALRRGGVIENWHDRKIGPGSDWSLEIDNHVNSAEIILLLISADFLASEYCTQIEVKRAIERHKAGDARVIPIILRPVDWKDTEFSFLQVLPKDGKAVTIWPNIDEAFTNVAEGIRNSVSSLRRVVAEPPEPFVRDLTRFSFSLEAAVPPRMLTSVHGDVVAMIAAPGSAELKTILSNDRAYTALPDDVKSQQFELAFANSVPIPVRVHLWAPDFEPNHQETELSLDPGLSTQPIVFLVSTAKPGTDLLLKVDLLVESKFVTTRLLRTNAIAPAEPEPMEMSPPVPRRPPRPPQGWVVVLSLPLTIRHVDAYAPAPSGPKVRT